MAHVFVTDPVAPDVIERLQESHSVSLGYGGAAQQWDEVASTIDASLVRGETIGPDRIRMAPRLKIIARHGVGTDNVALDVAQERGIWVTTTPGANARAVAEHVFALLLAVARKVPDAWDRVRDGVWGEHREDLVGRQLQDGTLLLVGGGVIAQEVLPIARGFGMRVIVSDPYLSPFDANVLGVELVDLDVGLAEADVVSLHVPLTDDTRHLLNADRLDRMKPNAIVVNTARGGVIDEQALFEKLRRRELAGAGLDVIEAEDIDMKNPLPHSQAHFDTPRLVVTPHIAAQSTEALHAVGMRAVDCIEAVLRGQEPEHAVVGPRSTAKAARA